jgi:uncharacterized protein (TIGR02453 family)
MQPHLLPAYYETLSELVSTQNRDWFRRNRDRLRADCEAPMLAVLQAVYELCDAAAADDPSGAYLAVDPPRLFRLARDVRFSNDKRPYKEHIAGTIPLADATETGLAEQPAALYVHVGLEDRWAGVGWYAFPKPVLARWRARLLDDADGEVVAAEVGSLTAEGYSIDAIGRLKRSPPGVDPAHPRIDLLRLQGCAVGFPTWPEGIETTDAFVPWLHAHVQRTAPFMRWLAECR